MDLKKISTLLCFWLLSFNLVAAKPTIEGLIRNGNNPELIGNLVMVKLAIEEIANHEILQKTNVENAEEFKAKLEPLLMERKVEPKFIKFVFSLEKKDKIGLIQLEYSDGSMKNEFLDKVGYFPNLIKDVDLDAKLERSLFYSLVTMFSLNDSRTMSALFKKLDLEYKTNKELMNPEKISLLNRYKLYLGKIKESPEEKEELINPLKPQDEELNQKVKEVLGSSMYHKGEKVSLIRKGGKFFWEVALTNINALFTNDEQRIENLKIRTIDGEIKTTFGEYLLFNGIQELPKIMMIKSLNHRIYKAKFIDYKIYNSKKKFYKRVENYKKLLEKIKSARGFSPKSTDIEGTPDTQTISNLFLL
jgi:hypothetical protein